MSSVELVSVHNLTHNGRVSFQMVFSWPSPLCFHSHAAEKRAELFMEVGSGSLEEKKKDVGFL